MTLTISNFDRTEKLSTEPDLSAPGRRILKVSLGGGVNLNATNVSLGSPTALPTNPIALKATPGSAEDSISLLKGLLLSMVKAASVGEVNEAAADINALLTNESTPASQIKLLKRIVLQLESGSFRAARNSETKLATATGTTTTLLPADESRMGLSIFIPSAPAPSDPEAEPDPPRVLRISTSELMTATNLRATVEIKQGFYWEPPVNYVGPLYMISKDGANLDFNITTYSR